MEKLECKEKQDIDNQSAEKPILKGKCEALSQILSSSTKNKKFYEMPWFWICLTIIVMCITRPKKTIICGNGNGNGSGSRNTNNQG